MRSVKRLGLVLIVAAAAELIVSLVPLSSAPRETDRAYLAKAAVPIDFAAPYTANSFGFLRDAVGDRSIIELGESIHAVGTVRGRGTIPRCRAAIRSCVAGS